MQKADGLWKRFLGFLEGGAEDEEDWDGAEYVEYDREFDTKPHLSTEEIDYSSTESYDRKERTKRAGNVVDFDVKRAPHELTTVMILRPKVVEDATLVCDHLQDNRVCIIDMKDAEHMVGQRIADYLGGVCYALRGHVERIDTHTFVMAPDGVKIDSGFRDELESSGWFKKPARAQG
ncbi:MAG: cell division protein SepF [Defluviitaleaceae bacterium]|nr:cell division protein SepF [Defluviitaleaceae bacterium]